MREKILFNNDWNFHRGDIQQDYPRIKAMAYRSAKTERYLMGPAAQTYAFEVLAGKIPARGKMPFPRLLKQ